MKLPRGLRIGLALALLCFMVLSIYETIINYQNIKEIWVIFVCSFAGFLALLCSLFLLLFVKDKDNNTLEEQQPEPKIKEIKIKPRKQPKERKPFISEKEWAELEEEEEEIDYLDED